MSKKGQLIVVSGPSGVGKGTVLGAYLAGRENGGLQESGQAQSDDLLAPLDETIRITAWDAEHIETAHCNLNEQNAAALQVCEEDLYHGVGHQNDAE